MAAAAAALASVVSGPTTDAYDKIFQPSHYSDESGHQRNKRYKGSVMSQKRAARKRGNIRARSKMSKK